MDGQHIIDVSEYTLDELALRFCNGLHEQSRSDDPHMAVCAIPQASRPMQVDALAVVEADALEGSDAGISMQIYVDGRPVGHAARDVSHAGTHRMRATAGVTLLVPANERTEVSAAITSVRNAGATSVSLLLAFH
ncbi:hypothetical protein [Usitatibacter palustris]|uniref:Uncharacterized protein n=1 Tax=Usitatibacter palustris TaxID=2732487 RepID=A0A6M4H5F0_9PROT|nr:hypothetical protein [Usitatibacter palustris]QJR13754.1 hypothetical protein DSM104440_00544 [Usitatibacter palustris]